MIFNPHSKRVGSGQPNPNLSVLPPPPFFRIHICAKDVKRTDPRDKVIYNVNANRLILDLFQDGPRKVNEPENHVKFIEQCPFCGKTKVEIAKEG